MFVRALLGLLASLAAVGADWPWFLGPNGDGTSPETGLIDRIPERGLTVVFDRAAGTGYASPAVRDGRLVLFHREGREEIVEALDPKTADSRWRFAYPSAYQDPYGYNNGPRCAPLVTSNRVFTFGAEGKLVCLDFASGKLV